MKLFFSCIALATELKNEEIRVQNVKIAGKSISLNEFNELQISNPKIWREFLVSPETSFYRLHHIIQIVMGWDNCHLFEFESENYHVGQQYEDDGYNRTNEVINSQNLRIGDVIKKKGHTCSYPYDFGDYWQHLITLEMIIEDLRMPFPICCFGELKCPPEDVESLPGFYDSLKIIENPRHPEHKNYNKWVKGKNVSLEDKCDSKKFNLKRVNLFLMNLDVYIEDWDNESQ